MASTLNSKRVFLMMVSILGLLAALVCIGVLAMGLREATRERIFLVAALLILSAVFLALSFRFKDAVQLSDEAAGAASAATGAPADPDDVPLPQNAAANPEPDPDDVALPQNAPGGGA